MNVNSTNHHNTFLCLTDGKQPGIVKRGGMTFHKILCKMIKRTKCSYVPTNPCKLFCGSTLQLLVDLKATQLEKTVHSNCRQQTQVIETGMVLFAKAWYNIYLFQ